MGDLQITLSGNAGVSVETENTRIWVDAMYGDAEPSFSPMTDALAEQVMDSPHFQKPDMICYTHSHSDHYSRERLSSAYARWGEIPTLLPWEGSLAYQGQGIAVEFLPLPHEGAQYAHVAHFGVYLTVGDWHILLPGDCRVAAQELALAIQGREIDVVVLDFPWITLGKGKAFIKKYFSHTQILGYHLPFVQDDCNGYRIAAEKAVATLNMDIRLLYNPLQTEVIKKR